MRGHRHQLVRVVIVVMAVVGIIAMQSPKIAQQWERAIVLRLGRFLGLQGQDVETLNAFGARHQFRLGLRLAAELLDRSTVLRTEALLQPLGQVVAVNQESCEREQRYDHRHCDEHRVLRVHEGLRVSGRSIYEACREAAEDPGIAADPAALQARYAALEAARGEVTRLYTRWAELEAKQV
jgi:hypothetical protein